MNTWAIIGVVVAAVGVIITYIQWAFSNAIKKGANNQKLHDTHERIKSYDNKSIECEKRFVRLEERKADNVLISDIRTDIILMRNDLSTVKDSLSGKVVSALIQAHSPVSLTEEGKRVAKSMNIETRISNNWDNISRFLIENIPSENAYDIQQFCIETATVYPERFLGNDDMEFLKNFAFGQGKPLAYYGGMIGVMIRDKYFEYKGIDIRDRDDSDPAK